jgi:hypothetical protein
VSESRRQTQRDNKGHYAFPAGNRLSWKRALIGPEGEQWKQAMQEEMASFKQKKTWELVKKPIGKKLLPCFWILNKKLNEDGTVARYKARLVVLGNHQQFGIDFKETFSPTLKFSGLRVLIHLATIWDLEVLQFDINTAFLNSVLEEELYMYQPDGIEQQLDSEGDPLVCRLLKPRYGLRQSPRQWKLTLDEVMKSIGFIRLQSDGSIYKRGDGESQVICSFYVDDGIVLARSIKEARDVIHQISKSLDLKYQGNYEGALGMSELGAEQGSKDVIYTSEAVC